MSQDGRLILSVLAPDGEYLGGSVDIELRHQFLSHRVELLDADASDKVEIGDLHRTPQGTYRLRVTPAMAAPISQFVTIKASGDTPLTITSAQRRDDSSTRPSAGQGESLFRVLLSRPARGLRDNDAISLSRPSRFMQRLEDALQGESPRDAAIAVANEYIASDDFVGDLSSLDFGSQLEAVSEALDALTRSPRLSREAVVTAIEGAFDERLPDIVTGDLFGVAVTRVSDSIVAIKYAAAHHHRDISALARHLRDLEVISRVAGDNTFPAGATELRSYRTRGFRLPPQAALQSVLSSRELDKKRRTDLEAAEAARRKEISDLLASYRNMDEAIRELTGFHATDLQSTPLTASDAVSTPDDLQPTAVLAERVGTSRTLSTLLARALEAGGEAAGASDGALLEGAAALASTAISEGPALLSGRPRFEAPNIEGIGFRLTDEAAERATGKTKRLVASLGLDLRASALDRVVFGVQQRMTAVQRKLDGVFGRARQTSLKRVGTKMVFTNSPVYTPWTEVLYADGVDKAIELAPPDTRIPQSRGSIAPPAVGDLLITRQQLTGYERSDVAHIENVLRSERKLREHTRRRETEQVTFAESEVTTSEERDHEATDRFEMSRETSQTIQEDASLKAGLTVSGKYGPTIEFSASAEASSSTSKEQATRTAASFSQDVTQRSATRITKRILERTSLRVTNEVTERNEHALDNSGGADHVSGVYQWVTKVYQAQLFNYGIRAMFDFMVPEPAELLIHVMQSDHANAVSVEKPIEFTLQPNQVTEHNYGFWVREYGATDVEPPPERYLTVSHSFHAGGGDSKKDYYTSALLSIEDGYQAVHGSVGIVWNQWNSKANADFVLGRRGGRILDNGQWFWSSPLADERSSIPFALETFNMSQIAVAVEVKCERTDRAMRKWAADTHAKLTTAYRARLAEYEDELGQLQVETGVAIEGKNPATNQATMMGELKRHCISILTDQHFDLFGAIETGFSGLPQIDTAEAEAEGRYVRFFEQAFEWEHLTWVTYPYFWGRKARWAERLTYEDPDPVFNDFLKSGFCRVSVPARPGFEGAIDHFLNFGELWDGGPLPPVSSPLYLPIAVEIAERLDRPGTEFPEGAPWVVRIPTSLVKLRSDDRLPEWEQAADGTWVAL